MIFLERLARWIGSGTKPERSFPTVLWNETLARLPFLNRLNAEEKARLRHLAGCFLAEKEFTGAGGLELTDAICVSIAAQACLPILNLGLGHYAGWVGIVVYPDEFVIPRVVEDETGVVHEYDDHVSGEAWEGGPVLVSWKDAEMAGEGYNVVIHEFAHKLDMCDGNADGIPSLPPDIAADEWKTVFLDAFHDFQLSFDEVPETHAGDDDGFDGYAATAPEEFFAVMSEVFFEKPRLLYNEFPALYALFTRFYRQDTAHG